VVLTVFTVSVVGALALALIERNLSQREAELLETNARAVARQASPLLRPAADRYGLQQLADTAAFLGNAQVRILDRAGLPLVDSGPRGAADRLLWFARPERSVATETSPGGPWVILSALTPGRMPLIDDPVLREFLPDARVFIVRREASAWGSQLVFEESRGQSAPPAEPEDPLPPTATRVSVPVVDGNATLGFVELSSASSYGGEALSTAQRALLLAALGAAALAIGLGLWVSRGLAAPLRSLATTAGRMAQGDLSARAPMKNRMTRDEIDQLAEQFNAMAQKLESSFGQLSAERDALRRFVADASHELRTPITSLVMANELLQGPAGDDPVARSEFLAQNAAQLKRLEWITSNLLDLSRLDAGIAELNLAEHDVGDVLQSATQPFYAVADQRGVALACERTTGIAVRCDRARVEIALSNLIDNALKFTPSGGSVTMRAEARAGAVRLLVRDTGIGVAEEDQAHVFDRFYRGANQRAEGSGLGLAIVRSIAQAHGGTAFVESAPGRGSTFGIELPQQAQ
jgi:signal transduction histidine kinase